MPVVHVRHGQVALLGGLAPGEHAVQGPRQRRLEPQGHLAEQLLRVPQERFVHAQRLLDRPGPPHCTKQRKRTWATSGSWKMLMAVALISWPAVKSALKSRGSGSPPCGSGRSSFHQGQDGQSSLSIWIQAPLRLPGGPSGNSLRGGPAGQGATGVHAAGASARTVLQPLDWTVP